jgi:hypothetical protein
MHSVARCAVIDASPDAVWRVVRDFENIDRYLEAVADVRVEGRGAGAQRTLTLHDGGTIVERLEQVNDDLRVMQYVIVESPLPVGGYTATLSIDPVGTESVATWASVYNVTADGAEEEVEAAFADLYTAGLEGLRAHCEGQAQ